MTDEDDVGYRRPPKGRRFGQPGGNPRGPGRQKGSKNVSAIFSEVTGERITAKSSAGGSRKITKLEAAVTQLANKAASGDLRAIAMVIAMAQAVDERSTDRAPPTLTLNEGDKRAIELIAQRVKQKLAGSDNAD